MGTAMLTVAGVAVAAAVLLAGLILFVLGVLKRRRKIWVGGAGLALFSVLATSGVIIWAGGKAWARVTKWFEFQDRPAREWLQAATGIVLPPDAGVEGAATKLYAIPPLEAHYAALKVPPTFEEELVRRFEHARWSEIKDHVHPGPSAAMEFWRVDRFPELRAFRGTRDSQDGAHWSTFVFYDQARGIAYVHAAEAWN